MELHAKNKKAIRSTYRQLKEEATKYQVYRKKNMPRHLRYGKKDDRYGRIGDILLLSDAPKVFHFSSRKPSPGTHGYDACQVKEMHATFYAWGPAFRKGVKVPTFENVEVYPLIAKLLGLTFDHKIDGKGKLLKEVL